MVKKGLKKKYYGKKFNPHASFVPKKSKIKKELDKYKNDPEKFREAIEEEERMTANLSKSQTKKGSTKFVSLRTIIGKDRETNLRQTSYNEPLVTGINSSSPKHYSMYATALNRYDCGSPESKMSPYLTKKNLKFVPVMANNSFDKYSYNTSNQSPNKPENNYDPQDGVIKINRFNKSVHSEDGNTMVKSKSSHEITTPNKLKNAPKSIFSPSIADTNIEPKIRTERISIDNKSAHEESYSSESNDKSSIQGKFTKNNEIVFGSKSSINTDRSKTRS